VAATDKKVPAAMRKAASKNPMAFPSPCPVGGRGRVAARFHELNCSSIDTRVEAFESSSINLDRSDAVAERG
jgi:hypothetical protein